MSEDDQIFKLFFSPKIYFKCKSVSGGGDVRYHGFTSVLNLVQLDPLGD